MGVFEGGWLHVVATYGDDFAAVGFDAGGAGGVHGEVGGEGLETARGVHCEASGRMYVSGVVVGDARIGG